VAATTLASISREAEGCIVIEIDEGQSVSFKVPFSYSINELAWCKLQKHTVEN